MVNFQHAILDLVPVLLAHSFLPQAAGKLCCWKKKSEGRARGQMRTPPSPGEAGAKHDMQRASAPTMAAQSDGGTPAPLVEDTVEGLLLAVQHSRGRQPAGGEVAGSADTATTSALEPCPPPGPAPGRHDAAGDGEGRSMDVEEDDELSAGAPAVRA